MASLNAISTESIVKYGQDLAESQQQQENHNQQQIKTRITTSNDIKKNMVGFWRSNTRYDTCIGGDF